MAYTYSETLIDHFQNPRNVGELEDADAVGELSSDVCGDLMKLYLKIEGGVIKDIKFRTFGCAAAIASSSVLTEMIKGKTIEEALEITKEDIAKELDGVPEPKLHCSLLAADAFKVAVDNYHSAKKG